MGYGAVHIHVAEKGRGLTVERGGPNTPRGTVGDEAPAALAFPAGSETDATLVARARDGDRDAFEALVRRHLKAAYPVALSRVANPLDAEDVVQDAFLTALEKIDSCERPEHFRAWLLAIVRNRAHNVRKYERVRKTEPLEQVHAPATGADPAREVDRQRIRERVEAALDRLTELQRRVVVLHDYEGWRHKEIGTELNISPGASRFHLHVARKRLREELADLKDYLPGERT